MIESLKEHGNEVAIRLIDCFNAAGVLAYEPPGRIASSVCVTDTSEMMDGNCVQFSEDVLP